MRYYQIALNLIMLVISGCDRSTPHHFQGFVEGENIYLAAPFEGKVLKKLTDHGLRVKKGDLVFQLDTAPQSLLVASREADLNRAQHTLQDLLNPKRPEEIKSVKASLGQTEAELHLAELRLKRVKELNLKQAIDKESVDEAEAHLVQLQELKKQREEEVAIAEQGARREQIAAQKAQVASAAALLKEAKWQLSQKQILAPNSGLVIDTYFKEGEFVPAQRPVVNILLDESKVIFFVNAQDLAWIKMGDMVKITCPHCQAVDARVKFIAAEAQFIPPLIYSTENQDRLVYKIEAALPFPTTYKPGQAVDVIGIQHDA